jgi:hypothetical protein
MNMHISVYTGISLHADSCAQVFKRSHSGLKVCNFPLKIIGT